MKLSISGLKAKITSFAAILAIAAGSLVVTPQKAEAFGGYFGFSTEGCYDKIITTYGSGTFTSPFSAIVDMFTLGATIRNIEFWATNVCDESDAERASDAFIQAAWVGCVSRQGNSTERSRLGLSRGDVNDPSTSSRLWPYSKFSWSQRVRRNRSADAVLRDATGGLSSFVGTTDHPSRVLNDTQINQMLSRCGYSRADVAEAAADFFLND